MYQFVIFVLYFTIAGLFAVSWFALKKWSSKLHTYLFFSCAVNLLYDMGVLLELRATDQQTFVTALKLGYLGRIWIGLTLVLFVTEMSGAYIPTILKAIAALIHVVIYITILNLETNDLYYNYMEFTMDGDFPRLLHTGGPLYYVQTALSLTYAVGGIYLIIRTYVREKDKIAKRRDLLIVIAMISVGVSYVIYFFKLVPLARKFDVMIIGYAICTVFMLIAIIKYKMLDAPALAKDFVVDEMSEGIFVVDELDHVTYFNKPAQKLFPFIGEGEKSDNLIKSLLDNMRDAIATNEPMRLGGRIYTPKSNDLIEDGKDVGTLYSLTDDTNHYKYMDELREQKRIADSANMAKSQFLANMSHEIRTPINAVLGLNEMVIRECEKSVNMPGSEDPATKEVLTNINVYSGNIQSAGNNLLAIINDILDFSKIEAGRMDIVNAEYTLSSLINDVSNMVSFKAEEKGLRFIVDVDEALPDKLCGDKVRIRQIITNILTNAVKYTNTGTVRLVVRGFIDEADDQLIRLMIEVKDTGIGIRTEDINKLFNKFQRLELERNSTVEGAGLGLAIAGQLLSIMDGTVTVESNYGTGSTFKIELPQKIVSKEPVGNFRERFEESVNNAKAYKMKFRAPEADVLVVDDTRLNLMVAKGLLKDTKIQITTADSGEDALRLTGRNKYDLIFMDQRMPQMDGTEALNLIREQEEGLNRETPIICMTADAIIGAREKYIEKGFDDYLPKPLDSRDLEQTLMRHLPPNKIVNVG